MKRKRSIADRLRSRNSLPEKPRLGAVREFLQRRRREAAPAELPAGDLVDTVEGQAFVRRTRYADGATHGRLEIGAARDADWALLASRAHDEALAEVETRECLFLDTETTGLSGGAGTTVFMIGLGFFESDEFVVEQLFLRSFGEERALLAHFADRLERFPVLVTYVGKSFDRHRIASRLTLHDVAAPILTPRHLDLYYLSRRAWRDQLPDVRLQTVERERLGLRRSDDLPGSEAPQAFLDWVRDGTGEIARVFEHNRLDVLTLVTLMAALGTRG